MFQKVNTIVMWVFIAIGVILMVMTMLSEPTAEQSECVECGAGGGFITLSYVLLIGAIVAAVAGSVVSIMMKPESLKGSLIGIGAMLVVFALSFVLADGSVEPMYGDITESTSRWSGAGLYTFYILFVLAVLSIVYSSVSRLMK
ncbi:MAG: hypothetical protein HN542_04545 [Flavobacteriales bacterium]|jgi:uncharacterized membrane protein YecN with MAPEG domain|nr:hypothetical protein [Flavobacteriales bacterium]NCG29088.1 hypothetical protein [Bacteroidota bacterium]MBT3964112.1 hypothetical protein [Flavobacteriales bacterium]MBT4705943.1 hypothetical protein [Flavobacteriales bacterium]MBT4931535.1 hypothetical protein [Flavobacteriales bacterium]